MRDQVKSDQVLYKIVTIALCYMKSLMTVDKRRTAEVDLIKYAHNTYDSRTRKITLRDTIVSLPEEKADICQHDSKCWRVPGACTCIVIDDGVTSMMNVFDRDNAMLGRITFFENLPFLTIDD